jgi:hypothetical protein
MYKNVKVNRRRKIGSHKKIVEVFVGVIRLGACKS